MSATALIAAVRSRQLERVRELMRERGAAGATGERGRTALHVAAEEGYEPAARLLLDAGWAVDARMSFDGETPLHKAAAIRGNIDLTDPDTGRANFFNPAPPTAEDRRFAELMLKIARRRGVTLPEDLDVEARLSSEDKAALFAPMCRLLGNRDEMMRELCAEGVDVKALPLDVAERLLGYPGHLAVAALLLERGADVNATNSYGATPLMLAAEFGEVAMAELLLKHGALIDGPPADDADSATESALARAISFARPGMIELLMRRGASLPEDDFILHNAAGNGQTDVLRILLACHFDIEALNDEGETPLLYAASRGHASCMQLLIDAGADVHTVNAAGAGILHLAYLAPCIRLGLGAGLDPNLRDGVGATPLHRAASSLSVEAVRLLIAAGAALDAQDAEGNTPLHAIFFGEESRPDIEFTMFRPLVLAGARLDLRNADGHTAYDLAVLSKYPEECRLLLDPARPLAQKPEFLLLDAGVDAGFSIHAITPMVLDGAMWPSAALYFHAQKFKDPAARERIRNGRSMQDVFVEDRALPRHKPKWSTSHEQLMLKALRAKFLQHPQLREKLRATGNAYLIEDSIGEAFWTTGAPHNTLGMMIMKIRQELEDS